MSFLPDNNKEALTSLPSTTMSPSDSSKKSGTNVSDVYVRKGLEGQDEDFDVLQGYFRQMQTMTVETSMDSDIDLLTFALSAHYFGVVMMKGCVEPSGDVKDEGLQPEEDADALPKDLDDAELAELNIPPPITVEAFLALPEKEKTSRWDEAWEAKKRGSLYDDSDYSGMEESVMKRQGKKRVLRPGDIDFYMSDEDDSEAGLPDKGKGKMREQGVWVNPHPIEYPQPIPTSVNDHLINWPESDGGSPPPSDDDFHSDMSESPSSFGFQVDSPPVDPNFGREYFAPDTEPALQLPPILEDPIAKLVVREAALRKVDELRAQTVHLYEKKKARLARRRALEADDAAPTEKRKSVTCQKTTPKIVKVKPIGLVYLTSSQNFMDPLHMGECNIGIYVAPEYRTLDRLSIVLDEAIETAFRHQECHRLQAVVLDHPDVLDFLNLYASAGFRQEGIRRRAFFSQIACEWKDVRYLAILATEWIHDRCNMTKAKILSSSLWDEILSRHQREQEEFIRMEEQKTGNWPRRLKRSSSVETIRETIPESGGESSGFMTDGSSSSSVSPSFKRMKLSSNSGPAAGPKDSMRSPFQSSESGFESEWDMASAADADEDFFSVGTDPRFVPASWEM